MNIVYISHLTNAIASGPNFSVPAQVISQSKIDNVFWYNLTTAVQDHWLENGVFHGISEYPQKKIMLLPPPFNRPDLVIFESFYYFDDIRLSCECQKNSIPYIIVPRSAFTKYGQKEKWCKKVIANFLIFKSMTKKAVGIQYLTEAEYQESGNKWNDNSFIIPNGVYSPTQIKKWDDTHLHGLYVGRFAPYQKGLDLLMEACEQMKQELEKNKVVINLHGPERFGEKAEMIEEIKRRELESILQVKEGVFGIEKQNVFLSADFFIMTSRFEGHPMSMIEALSYGLPVLATAGTNMADKIRVTNSGWSCDNSVKSIMDGLRLLILEKDSFIEKSKNAVILSKTYDWNSLAQECHDTYLRLLHY